MAMLRFDVFGTLLGVEAVAGGWRVYLLGADGKRRRADVEVPSFVAEDELCQYLADLYHEAASPERPDAFRLP